MQRVHFTALLDELLTPGRFTDVAENGLQVEGGPTVSRIVCGVTANLALIDAAIAASADAIVVHHGLVWGGGIRRLDGWLKTRVERLLRHGVSLYAYHLPLDAHLEVGNNVGLAKALGVFELVPFGRYKGQTIGVRGVVESGTTLSTLIERARAHVVGDGAISAFGEPGRPIRTVGLCTGGAPDLLYEAASAGLDAYVTGETTEFTKAIADESGTAFLALGHHATERFGPRALAESLVARGLDASFIDVDNPS
jgi:dinuclear metal center YbgI/SA1388 family protein